MIIKRFLFIFIFCLLGLQGLQAERKKSKKHGIKVDSSVKSDSTNIVKSEQKQNINIDSSRKTKKVTVNAPSVTKNRFVVARSNSNIFNSNAPGVINIENLNLGGSDHYHSEDHHHHSVEKSWEEKIKKEKTKKNTKKKGNNQSKKKNSNATQAPISVQEPRKYPIQEEDVSRVGISGNGHPVSADTVNLRPANSVGNGNLQEPMQFAADSPKLGGAGLPGLNIPGLGLPGKGLPGLDVPGLVVPGLGVPGSGLPGKGLPGLGLPGLGLPGLSLPGLGIPGLGLPGKGLDGLGVPGLGLPGKGVPGLGVPGLGGEVSPGNPQDTRKFGSGLPKAVNPSSPKVDHASRNGFNIFGGFSFS